MAAFQKFDVQAYLRGEYEPPQSKTFGSLGTLGRGQSNSQLNEAELFELEERAAIMQYDGKISRNIAEKLASDNVIDMRKYRAKLKIQSFNLKL